MRSTLFGRSFGLVIRKCSVARRRRVAVDLPVLLHRLPVLPLLGQLSGLLQLLIMILLRTQRFNTCDGRIIRVD